MELEVEQAGSLFWKMGPLITLGAEEEPGEAPCVSSQRPPPKHTEHRGPHPAGRGAQDGQPVPSSYLPTLGPSFHPQLRLKAAGALISHPKPDGQSPSPAHFPQPCHPAVSGSLLHP